MCGIAGFVYQGLREDEVRLQLTGMTNRVKHRGPDDHGTWIDVDAGVALGHQRLSIIDLSSAGHQPMTSSSGRYVMTYNGEIYNFRQLRKELTDTHRPFRGGSDTEVVLEAIDQWGLVDALHRFRGMFAIALWDREERTLHLARDRFGKKPMYYTAQRGYILFGSELKALREHPIFSGTISRAALSLYFRYNCIPSPYTIYEGVHKLAAGSILTVKPGNQLVPPHQYWSARDAFLDAQRAPFQEGEKEATEELENILGEAVADRMVADVPLGAFLSGGIDSSTAVALMQQRSSKPIKTFTIGSGDMELNEADTAKRVANYLGTEHTEMYVSPRNVFDTIPKLSEIYDEPFADSSAIPTYLVSEITRRHVKVALSGDGGDELFGGYNRYVLAGKLLRLQSIPPATRHRLGNFLLNSLLKARQLRGARGESELRSEPTFGGSGRQIRRIGEALLLNDPQALYLRLVSSWQRPGSVVIGGEEPSVPWSAPESDADVVEVLNKMMLRDVIGYLTDDILVKLDRASMAVGLEARAPFLDHRVAAFAWSLPTNMKIKGSETKRILRKVLRKHIPEHLVTQQKKGFSLPVGRWLREDLRDWAEDLLAPSAVRSGGYLNASLIQNLWLDHLNRPGDGSHQLWAVLMFQSWLAAQKT